VPGVVGTLMTNMAVELALRRINMPMARAKVGDRYVLEELAAAAGSWAARARATCWRWTATPPATASSARCRSAGHPRSGKTLWRPAGGVTLFPQTLINVRLRDGSDWQRNAAWRCTPDRHARTGRRRPGADPRVGHRAGAAGDGRGARRRPRPPLRRAPGGGCAGRDEPCADA
jgi:hypothetical protein